MDQTKSLLMNIITGVIIVGILIAGYYVFLSPGDKSTSVSPANLSVTEIASRTALVGTEVESTVKDLRDLNSAVANAVVIFGTPAFQNLEDFSLAVPSEPVGRPNPFVLTSWKENLRAIERGPTDISQGAPVVSATGSGGVYPGTPQGI